MLMHSGNGGSAARFKTVMTPGTDLAVRGSEIHMKRILIKAGVLIIIFFAAVYGFSYLLNSHDTAVSTKQMDSPTLPVMMIDYNGTYINRMYGYEVEMSSTFLRDTVTLVPFDRTLNIVIDTFGGNIGEVNYNIISLDDGSIVENGRVKSFEKDGTLLTASFHIDDPITMRREYMLRFDLKLGDGSVYYYYTRIVQRNGQNLNWYTDYTQAFYQNCIQKNMTQEMVTQLEPDLSQSNSSLHFMNIHSDADKILWGNLTPVLVKKAVPEILEINETTVSVGLEYVISAQDESGTVNYYSVSEFYRMRKAQEFVVLIDFERTTEQYFGGEASAVTKDGINIGITGKNVRYVTDSTAEIAAFIQNGEIWEYNRTANKASRVFSYHSGPHTDERCEHRDYGLQISNVGEDGTVTFVVYGYMNSGIREGSNGIALYRYDMDDNTTRELLFIESDLSYEVLERSLSRLAYINANNTFFFCYGSSICSVDLENPQVYYIQNDIDYETFVASGSQRLVAWTVESDGEYKLINELDLNTGEVMKLEAPDNEQIKTLAFLGEDLVYGRIRNVDSYEDEIGTVYYPMYNVSLCGIEGNTVKSYQQGGVYIYNVVKDSNILSLKRFYYAESQRIYMPDEEILYNEAEAEAYVTVKLTVNRLKGTEVGLDFTEDAKTGNMLTMHTRYIENQAGDVIRLGRSEIPGGIYLIYAKGRLYGIYNNPNTAIQIADSQVGVVLDSKCRYVWERGNYSERALIDTSQMPSSLINYPPVEADKLQKILGYDHVVMNMGGCPLSSLKYQLDNGYPVAAKWDGGLNILIIGYDYYNIWFHNPETGAPQAIAFEDAEAQFAAYGNVFISYRSIS